ISTSRQGGEGALSRAGEAMKSACLVGAAAIVLALATSAVARTEGDASARLDDLDRRITRLEDVNAIERLQRTYGYLVDKAQWEPLGDLFSGDATLEIGGRGIYVGKDRVLAYMQTGFGADGTQADRLM